MVRPRKGARSAAQAGKKRKKDDFFEDAEGDEDEFFVQSGDEGEVGSESEEEDAEAAETAEEKRLRLGAALLLDCQAGRQNARNTCGHHACCQRRRAAAAAAASSPASVAVCAWWSVLACSSRPNAN